MTLAKRRALAAVLMAALVPGAAEAAARRTGARTRPSPEKARPAAARPPDAASRPDAALYAEAQRAHQTLSASKARLAQPAEWEKVVLRYRRVPARYPQSGYCDNALLAVGDLYREMGRRFR